MFVGGVGGKAGGGDEVQRCTAHERGVGEGMETAIRGGMGGCAVGQGGPTCRLQRQPWRDRCIPRHVQAVRLRVKRAIFYMFGRSLLSPRLLCFNQFLFPADASLDNLLSKMTYKHHARAFAAAVFIACAVVLLTSNGSNTRSAPHEALSVTSLTAAQKQFDAATQRLVAVEARPACDRKVCSPAEKLRKAHEIQLSIIQQKKSLAHVRLVQASQKKSDLHPESLELKHEHVSLAAVPSHPPAAPGKVASAASHSSSSQSGAAVKSTNPAVKSAAASGSSKASGSGSSSASSSSNGLDLQPFLQVQGEVVKAQGELEHRRLAVTAALSDLKQTQHLTECAVGDKSCLALGGMLAIAKAKAIETSTAAVEKAKKDFEDQKEVLIALIDKRVKMEGGLEVAINAALDKSKQDKDKAAKLKKAASRALTLAQQAKEREEAAAALSAQQAAEAKAAMEEAEKEAKLLMKDNADLTADGQLEGTLEQRAAKLQAAASAAAASARSDSDAAVEAANQLLFVYREHLNVHQSSSSMDNLQKELKDVGTQVRGFDWKKAIKDTTYDTPLEDESSSGFLSTTLDKVVFGCCVSVIALALIALAFNAYKKRQSASAAAATDPASAPRSSNRPSSYRVLV
jgi:hypothetical protein